MTQLKPSIRTIFIADDDIDDLDLYKEIFADFPGTMLTCFQDGQYLFNSLMQLPGDHLPELVILDLNMPLWSGYKTVEAIRNVELLKQISIVIITTSNYDRDREQCQQYNIPMFTKASSYAEVKAVFQGLLGAAN